MRMWGIPPELMCHRHLNGEHYDLHVFAGKVANGKSLVTSIQNGFLDIELLVERHKDLEDESKRRGGKASSPLPDFDDLMSFTSSDGVVGVINVASNLQELINRCPLCCKRVMEAKDLNQLGDVDG